MATRHAHCPRCGLRLAFEAIVGERIVCPNCEARLRVLGRSGRSSGDDPLTGRRFGDYEIIEVLGRGGMGAVYKARRASSGRFVALKVLPRTAGAEDVARLRREARAVAAVRDPHIINVYSLGRLGGRPFLAMEFVEGESLKERLGRVGYLDAAEAVRLVKQVARALAKAHAIGLVHRDIKPGNILLTPAGDAKIADFGLAKRPDGRGSGGHVLGTAHYISPEAVLKRNVDARSDLYSLGATFYHMLAGRPPCRGNSKTGVLDEHVVGEPRPLGEVRPELPRELCWVVHRLLRKKPSARFQSAGELLAALEAVEAGFDACQETAPTPILPWSPTPFEGRKAKRGHPVAWAAGAGLAVVLAGLLLLAARGRVWGAAPEPPSSVASATE